MADQPNPNLPASSPAIASAEAARPAARPAERRSLGRRSASLVRRWARDTFNREQLLSSLRSLAWVAPLTLLIWIYAEREQQATLPARFQIVVKSANPSQIATSPEQNVMATLKGPKARLEAVIEKLDPRSNAGAVQIVVDGNRQPGQQYEVDIVAQVQRDFRLDGSGITVQDCTPRQIRVDVDALQEVELEVRADPQLRLPTKPTFDPPTVKVTAPAAAIIRAAKGDFYAKANLPNLPPGPHSLKAVPVTVEGLDPKLPVRPGTVAATVELGQADMEYTIPSVPVFPLVEADPQVMETHKLRFEQFVPRVVVVGPPDKIKRLEDPTVKPRPKARFEVTDLDVGKQRLTRELKFELPEGISLKDAAPRTITFDLLPKDPS